ncbi:MULTISPECIES: carbon-nitrogen hydrolase family protein [unclassified Novosphingobium]|uniref:carbon-nitrogen hydrolase family protein n=1 Tax=unclassified Novosphingobium TaxID=2644732 RepID=UPI0014479CCA|nr:MULTISPECIES: carbon-nitrogen hydrolase family protein [unclassified Novosphingobium]NKJ43574.1 putative amidohydrolase [Novosphingobium sp. SG720]NMN06070.1 putative amidohydrolase [Novosphingobium sp. SG919]NMN88367.1 putative amidohydrolase [Novosphingobium sp. SG916]
MPRFTVAAAQYPIDRLADWAAYEAKLTAWVEEAVAAGAALLVFPEYGAMELASLDPATMGDLAGSIDTVSALLPRVDALHARLAQAHGVHILAASAPRRDGDGRSRNAARLFAPDGAMATQDKLIMTRFEREEWFITGGDALRVFDTALGRLAITICYDSEFPLLARAAVEAGAQVLLVPSCTDTLHGYWRVRLGSQARALEGQCFVVQSPTVGDAAWSPAVDVNRGAAGIYGPPDAAPAGGGMPADGVLALGEEGVGQWVYATIDTAHVDALRCEGGVLTVAHWTEQPGAAPLPAVAIVPLGGSV